MYESMPGAWRGTNRLYLEGADGPVLTSPSTLTAAWAAKKFLELRYDWLHENVVQEGVILFGAEGNSAAWVDSFHQSKHPMFCQGEPLNVKGSYSAGEGPDWGWRITLALQDEQLILTMYNIAPDGAEYLAVLAEYQR